MNDSSEDGDMLRMEQLASDKCNGSLDPQGHAELHQLLAKSAQLRACYCQMCAIHADLQWDYVGSESPVHDVMRHFSEQRDASTTPSSTRSSSPHNASRARQRSWAIAATLAAVLLGGWALLRNYQTKQERAIVNAVPQSHPAAPAPARLTALTANSRWSLGRPEDENSKDFNFGDTVSVNEGLVEMQMQNGAMGQIQAPATLKLMSDNRVRLLSGKIKVNAPQEAHGFTVETSSAEFVDLGTLFSVEAAETGADLVVYGGKVDLNIPAKGADDSKPVKTKQFTTGQAVRVDSNGTLSRIMNVQSAAGASDAGDASQAPLIASVTDNIRRDDFFTFYEIVQGGMGEDAPAYVDRFHEWNGVDESGMPDYLVGGDYVKMFNDDKMADKYKVEVTFSQPVTLYVLLDTRVNPPSWLTSSFTDTGDRIGVDESHHHRPGPAYALEVGPGQSIDQRHSIWKATIPQGGTIVLGPNGEAAPNNRWESGMYGIVATRLKHGE